MFRSRGPRFDARQSTASRLGGSLLDRRYGLTVAERLGLDPTAPMEWWDKGKVVRASLPDALVELGFLWIREGDFDR